VSAKQGKAGKKMEQGVHTAAPARGAAGLPPTVQAHLGLQLRAVYDDLAHQPIPDKFLQLLDALERQHASAAPPAAAKPDDQH